MAEALAMEPLDIFIVLNDYVMNRYTRELLILFRIMISLLCHAYKSIQVFGGIFLLFAKKNSCHGAGRTKQVFVRAVFLERGEFWKDIGK